MPLFDDYSDQLKSEIADFTNTGGRPAGSITAALFLKEFAGGLPWVHIDIAGTAWAEEAKPYLPKGPSGVAVRTLAELAFTSSGMELPDVLMLFAPVPPGQPPGGPIIVDDHRAAAERALRRSATCCSDRSG